MRLRLIIDQILRVVLDDVVLDRTSGQHKRCHCNSKLHFHGSPCVPAPDALCAPGSRNIILLNPPCEAKFLHFDRGKSQLDQLNCLNVKPREARTEEVKSDVLNFPRPLCSPARAAARSAPCARSARHGAADRKNDEARARANTRNRNGGS